MRLGCCEATITLWSPSQPLGPSGLGPLMGKSTENPAGFGHFSGMFWIANAESFDLEGGITGKTDKNFMALPDSSSDPEIEAQNEMVKMGLSHFPKPSGGPGGTGRPGGSGEWPSSWVGEPRLPVPPCAMSGARRNA